MPLIIAVFHLYFDHYFSTDVVFRLFLAKSKQFPFEVPREGYRRIIPSREHGSKITF